MKLQPTYTVGAVICRTVGQGLPEGRIERINPDGSAYVDFFDFDKTIPADELKQYAIVGYERN